MPHTATELQPRQLQVIEAIVSGASVTDAMRAAGADRVTFYHSWLRNERFQAELRRAKRENLDGLRAQLRALGQAALAVYREILTAPASAADLPRAQVAQSVLQCIGALDRGETADEPKVVMRELRWLSPTEGDNKNEQPS